MDVNPKFKEIVNTNISFRPTNTYIKYKDQFGYATSGSGKSARDNLYGTAFKHSIKYTAKYVRDKTIITQLSGLIIKNGRIDHLPNNHDDTVIAWLLCYWLLLEGRNLDVYGIPLQQVLSGIVAEVIEEQGGSEFLSKKEEQLKLKATIDKLIEQLSSETNAAKSFILVNRIKALNSEIDTSIIPPYNLASVLSNIKNIKN
jgi:hypothetical protein